ncbi:MAG: DNA-3-methyladenine glycosylase [Proteobacteria bacterium]|nr:DNA-3-methyladenine glycosylase [Pseudomonadota bacterium]
MRGVAEELTRCAWACKTREERDYHDLEWGAPEHDDGRLFEFLILEGAQAGLSWLTILRKREHYRAAFDGFDAARMARYDDAKLQALLGDPGIVRNRLKIEAAVANARACLQVREEFGSLDAYLWRFVDGRPIQNAWQDYRQAPTRSAESDALSKDLKHRGFKFVGSTICYALMQAVGMVNDHSVDCFRWRELSG